MRNWKISTRLAAAFGVLVVLLLAVAAVALLQLSALNAATKQITSNNLISVELINKLGADMIKARLLELRHVYNESPEYKANIEQQMTKLQAEMNDIKARYAPLVSSPVEASAYETLLAQRKEYVTLMAQLFQLFMAEPEVMPPEWQASALTDDRDARARAVWLAQRPPPRRHPTATGCSWAPSTIQSTLR